MDQTLVLLIALPSILAIIVGFLRRDCGATALTLSVLYAVIASMLVVTVFMISKATEVADVEIWNGQVTAKKREHSSYDQTYECHCITVQGPNNTTNRVCQTCTRTFFTVAWWCKSTIGDFKISYKESESRSVYQSPDPARYTSIQTGDPVAARRPYVNYVQAVPESLFSNVKVDKSKFKDLIPEYPDDVYDFYHVNRFLSPGHKIADADQWNQDIALGLRELGPLKQVNLIIVIANTNDPSYEYALRDHWDGANKNDVVVVIGSTQYPKIDFVRIISWTKNELFKAELRDEIAAFGKVDRMITHIALNQIAKNFERRQMREFSYLKAEISPPDWVIHTLVVLITLGAVGIWIYIPQISFAKRFRNY